MPYLANQSQNLAFEKTSSATSKHSQEKNAEDNICFARLVPRLFVILKYEVYKLVQVNQNLSGIEFYSID